MNIDWILILNIQYLSAISIIMMQMSNDIIIGDVRYVEDLTWVLMTLRKKYKILWWFADHRNNNKFTKMSNSPNVILYTQRQKLSTTPTFFSVTVFMYNFLQWTINLWNIATQVFPWSVKPVRMPFDIFDKILGCLLCTNPILEVYP